MTIPTKPTRRLFSPARLLGRVSPAARNAWVACAGFEPQCAPRGRGAILLWHGMPAGRADRGARDMMAAFKGAHGSLLCSLERNVPGAAELFPFFVCPSPAWRRELTLEERPLSASPNYRASTMGTLPGMRHSTLTSLQSFRPHAFVNFVRGAAPARQLYSVVAAASSATDVLGRAERLQLPEGLPPASGVEEYLAANARDWHLHPGLLKG